MSRSEKSDIGNEETQGNIMFGDANSPKNTWGIFFVQGPDMERRQKEQQKKKENRNNIVQRVDYDVQVFVCLVLHFVRGGSASEP